MVDVSAKADTERIAIAKGEVRMKKETLELIRAGAMKKVTFSRRRNLPASWVPSTHPT